MAPRRMLVVLDNARDAGHVLPLLPASPGSVVLVTSRDNLAGLAITHAAGTITLGVLTPEEAHQLLAQRLGEPRLRAEPQAAAEIVAACAHLPLALAVVAARAAAHPDFTLASLARELRHGRLEALRGDGPATGVGAVFSWSYDALHEPAARLFRLIGLHPAAGVTVAAAASLAGLCLKEAGRVLSTLAAANLLLEQAPGHYTAHDLLRAYAGHLVADIDSEQERDRALHRIIGYYLHTAYAAERLLDEHRPPINIGALPEGVHTEMLESSGAAMEWFLAERETLIDLLELAIVSDQQLQHLTWSMASFFYRRGLWSDLAATQRICAAASQRLGDSTLAISAWSNLSRALVELRHFDEALAVLEEALALAAAQGNIGAQANMHLLISAVRQHQDDIGQALRHLEQAVELFESLGAPRGRAAALDSIAQLHLRLGEHNQALPALRQALALYEELGMSESQATAWDNLGGVHRQRGELALAISCYERSLLLARELADIYQGSIVLIHLGDAQAEAGHTAAARQTWSEALSILEQMPSPKAAAVRERLRTAGG